VSGRRGGMGERLASRSGYGATVVVGLAASGACAASVAQPWARATATVAGLPTVEASVDGADVAPVAAALAVVCLAGFGAVLATRGWLRRALGVVIAGCAIAVLVIAVVAPSSAALLEDGLAAKGWAGGAYDHSVTLWRLIAAVAAAIAALCGAVIARYGGLWATMGSRYDSPARSGAARSSVGADGEQLSETAMWRTLDDGGDPTTKV
jgi:uncharacterized membrane protein (TIGR02234 family)